MVKKYLLLFTALFTLVFSKVYCATPVFIDSGLPGQKGSGTLTAFGRIIQEGIGLTAVIAVFALMFSGVMYLVSAGNEEKTKKAQKWIIWSLIGVMLAVSAWGIINLINNVKIG